MIKKLKSKSFQKGFSTLEILLALAILSLTLTSVILVTFGNQSTSIDSQTNNEALAKAQAQIETMRALAKTGLSTFINGTYCDDNSATKCSSPVDSFYDVKVTISDCLPPDTNCKQVNTDVTYSVSALRPQTVTFSTIVTNWQTAGGTCNSTLANPNGWKTPAHYDFSSTTLIPGNNGNGVGIADMKAYRQRLYLAVNSTPNNNPDTFYIFDLPSDPSQTPTYRGALDNAPSVGSAGLNAVAVAGTYAYVASGYGASFTTCANSSGTNTSCGQLQVVDVSDPTLSGSPLKYTLKMPGVTGTGGQAIGKSIYYSNGYVFLGLAKTASGPEFNVIDVGGGGGSASPTNPIWKGGYSVGNGVNAIFVKGNYAYIASPNSENMTIIDVNVNSQTFMQRVGGYSPSAGPGSDGIGSDYGESLSMVGNSVYLGRTYGTKEFYLLNATTPSSLSMLGSQDIGSGNQTSVNGLAVKSNFAFLITPAQFQVWDISNSASPAPWSSDGTAGTFLAMSSFGGSGSAFNCSGDYFYLAVASSQGNNKDIISIVGPGVPNTQATLVAVATPSTVAYGNTSTLSTTGGSSTGAVSFSAGASTGCSVSGTTLSVTSASGSCSITATKAADSNYNSATSAAIMVALSKATPTITWSNPASITYGTPLSATQLNASTGVAGTFTYTPASGTILSAGTQTLPVHFVPTDTLNYNIPSDKTVSLTVNKATPTISTTIFNAANNQAVTTITNGSKVYDKANFSGGAGTWPTGTVTFNLYINNNSNNCTNGSPTVSTGPLSSGSATSPASAALANTSANKFDFYQAVYLGDTNYNAVTAACEALTVN